MLDVSAGIRCKLTVRLRCCLLRLLPIGIHVRASNFGGKLCVETEIRDQNLDEGWVKRPSTVNTVAGKDQNRIESTPSLRLGIVVSPTSWIIQSITRLCQ
jgi:hypothetical protein